LEAMACGTPVVATDCPTGPREIIRDGVDGLLVPVGDSEALAAAMLRLLEDHELRQKMAAAARRRAEDFALERIMEQYENLLRDATRR